MLEETIQAGIIRILPQEVTARIAAGEVVERPASVVKELAENALDAGARRIHVEIADGGRALVRVSDDGQGMPPADLALCVLPHATSKLSSADDLAALTTLGFRGEALPSIASCSRFTLSSRARMPAAGATSEDQDSAWRIAIEGGLPARPEPRPAAGAHGSVVEVRDLFYNLPARAKFLKGAAAEAAACTDVLLRLALSRPDVGFSLSTGAHEVFSLLPCVNAGSPPAASAPAGQFPRPAASAAPDLPLSAYLRRARDVLGRTHSRGLLELAPESPLDGIRGIGNTDGNRAAEERWPGYRLYGLISPPALSRPNRSCIYLNVNGRPVKDRTLTSALLEACRHLLPPKRYPIAVLYLDLPGSDVDINVHPAKAEVRFRLPGLVYSLFHHALRRAYGLPVSSAAGTHPTPVQPGPPPVRTPLGAPRPLNGQATFQLWTPAPAAPTFEFSHDAEPEAARAPEAPGAPEPAAPVDSPSLEPVSAERAPEYPRPLERQTQAPQPVPARKPEQAPLAAAAVAPFRILGQAGGSYIVLEDDSGVKLIDQHALHERVLFEILLARAQGHSRGDAQGLLIPETLELSPVQSAVFNQDSTAAELLHNLGFSVEPFGPRTLAVSAVPAVFKSAPSSTAALVRDVLDALAGVDETASGGSKKPPDRASYREKAAYILSCKGAIKAGERLSVEQMAALVMEYRKRVSPSGFTCPHGRPVALEISWEDLQRTVGR